MKKILVIFLLGLGFLSDLQAQVPWSVSGTKTRFTKGLGIPVSDTVAVSPLTDTAQIVIRPQDGKLYMRYKSAWVAMADFSGYKLFSDSLFASGYTRRDRTKQQIDSLGAAKANALSGTTFSVPFFNSTSTLGTTTLITDGNNRFSLGGTILTNTNFRIAKELNEGTLAVGLASDGLIQTPVTSRAFYFYTAARTQAASFTTNINHFSADQGVFGAGSTVTEQNAFDAGSGLVGATNNYAFRGRIPSGANNWNAYMSGTANNYFNGRTLFGTTIDNGVDRLQVSGSSRFSGIIGVNTAPTANSNFRIGGTLTGGVTAGSIINIYAVQSPVTTAAYGYFNQVSTSASSFTLGNLYHYYADQSTLGAGSIVNNQHGFFAEATLTGAAFNYGFRGDIPAGANRWNAFMGGTANNHLNGRTLFGTTVDNGVDRVQIGGSAIVGQNLSANRFVNNSLIGAFTAPTGDGQMQIYSTNSVGLLLNGQGSINDIGLYNKTGGLAASVPTGTTNFNVAGRVLSTQYRLSALNTAPSSATDTGTTGEIRITAGFIHVCIATNTWVRSALTTW